MSLIQAFNDWGNIVTITPISLPFVAALIYFTIYPLVESFVII